MTATSLSANGYVRTEVWKCNKQQSDDKLSECMDRFAKIHTDEQLNKLESDRHKDDTDNGKYGHTT